MSISSLTFPTAKTAIEPQVYNVEGREFDDRLVISKIDVDLFISSISILRTLTASLSIG